jgi:hypothetical protein
MMLMTRVVLADFSIAYCITSIFFRNMTRNSGIFQNPQKSSWSRDIPTGQQP